MPSTTYSARASMVAAHIIKRCTSIVTLKTEFWSRELTLPLIHLKCGGPISSLHHKWCAIRARFSIQTMDHLCKFPPVFIRSVSKFATRCSNHIPEDSKISHEGHGRQQLQCYVALAWVAAAHRHTHTHARTHARTAVQHRP